MGMAEEERVKQFMTTPIWPPQTTTTTMAATAASKLCDSCKSATATLFCRADSAFLCIPCDSKIHAANKLASRHARVWMCEVCEQAPAHVTCKADAAALCVTCDRDIHSANPLARRHHRLPVVPFFDPAASSAGDTASVNLNNAVDDIGEEDEEAEAASWLIPNPNGAKMGFDMYTDIDDPYLDLEYGSMEPKFQLKEEQNQQTNSAAVATTADCDGVVPEQSKNGLIHGSLFVHGGGSDSCFDLDFLGSKAFPLYNSNGPSLSQSVSSSSLDVGVVPDGSAMIDISNPFGRQQYNNLSDSTTQATQLSGIDREARVLRYREKRKNRKFEKTIRYASRKAYAETRPRIKGRFAKRTDTEVEVDQIYGVSHALMAADTAYGVVPSF